MNFCLAFRQENQNYKRTPTTNLVSHSKRVEKGVKKPAGQITINTSHVLVMKQT